MRRTLNFFIISLLIFVSCNKIGDKQVPPPEVSVYTEAYDLSMIIGFANVAQTTVNTPILANFETSQVIDINNAFGRIFEQNMVVTVDRTDTNIFHLLDIYTVSQLFAVPGLWVQGDANLCKIKFYKVELDTSVPLDISTITEEFSYDRARNYATYLDIKANDIKVSLAELQQGPVYIFVEGQIPGSQGPGRYFKGILELQEIIKNKDFYSMIVRGKMLHLKN